MIFFILKKYLNFCLKNFALFIFAHYSNNLLFLTNIIPGSRIEYVKKKSSLIFKAAFAKDLINSNN